MTNQFNQDQNDLVSSDFYNHFNLNSNHSSRLNSKSSSNDMNNDYLFNSVSSPSKSSANEISSPESSKTSFSSQIHAHHHQRSRINNTNQHHLIAPKFNTENDDSQITKLFVGNLPTSTTLPELLTVFKKYGPVNEKLSVVKDQNYAFIHFYNRRDAQIALQEVNDSLFKDRYIRVQFSTSQGYTFNNKHKFTDKKRYNNNTDINKPTNSHTMPHSLSSSSIFNQQSVNKNYRPITGKSFNQHNVSQAQQSQINPINQMNDFQQTQNQLMHLLYLAQLQQQHQQQQQEQQNFTRPANIENMSLNSLINDTSNSASSFNQTFLMPNLTSNNIQSLSMLNNQSSQQSSNGMVRSNTMFSFPNNFNLKR